LKRRPLALILFLALSASTLQGCAEFSQSFRLAPPEEPQVVAPNVPPAPEVTPPPAPPAVSPPPVSVADQQFAEGMKALQQGGYERALELFSDAWQERPGHAGVAREFDSAVLGLKKNGDAAYAKGMWEEAGKRWVGSLRFIDHPAANPRRYPFTRSELRAKVDNLTAALAGKALTEYRRGEVTAAIADWKTILSYDPKNEEAALSLRTATKQLETLKKMPPGK
jgi:tetratricopeptide (TPR) repeat protein